MGSLPHRPCQPPASVQASPPGLRARDPAAAAPASRVPVRRAGEPPARGCGRRRRPTRRHALSALAGDDPAPRNGGGPRFHRVAGPCHRGPAASSRVRRPPPVDPADASRVARRPAASSPYRRACHRGVRRDPGDPGLRPSAHGSGPGRARPAREPQAGDARLVDERRGGRRLVAPEPSGGGDPGLVRRQPYPQRRCRSCRGGPGPGPGLHDRQSGDLPLLPRHAARAARRARGRGERGPEWPRRARPRPGRPGGGVGVPGRHRHAGAPPGGGRRPIHAAAGELPVSRPATPGPPGRHARGPGRPRRRAGWPERSGQIDRSAT